MGRIGGNELAQVSAGRIGLWIDNNLVETFQLQLGIHQWRGTKDEDKMNLQIFVADKDGNSINTIVPITEYISMHLIIEWNSTTALEC